MLKNVTSSPHQTKTNLKTSSFSIFGAIDIKLISHRFIQEGVKGVEVIGKGLGFGIVPDKCLHIAVFDRYR